MQDYKKLEVWTKSHKLVLIIYSITKSFPHEELYGLTNQIRRAVVSIAANIVEGSGRQGKKEFLKFLNIAFASACEVEYELLLSFDLKYINNSIYSEVSIQVEEIKKMIYGLIQKINMTID